MLVFCARIVIFDVVFGLIGWLFFLIIDLFCLYLFVSFSISPSVKEVIFGSIFLLPKKIEQI